MSLSLHFKTVCVRRGSSAKPAVSSPPADCILHRVLWEAPLSPQNVALIVEILQDESKHQLFSHTLASLTDYCILLPDEIKEMR